MTCRDRFVEFVRAQLGKPVLWAARGPEVFDCSGLVAWCLKEAGAADLRATHTAALMFSETPKVGLPLLGDLCFYGRGPHAVTHVAVWLSPEEVISADGATPDILDLAKSTANPSNRVRVHSSAFFRHDFIGTQRNKYVDDVDLACQ